MTDQVLGYGKLWGQIFSFFILILNIEHFAVDLQEFGTDRIGLDSVCTTKSRFGRRFRGVCSW